MGYKDPEKQRAYKKEYYERNKAREKERTARRYERNKEQMQEYATKYREDIKKNAHDSITNGEIPDTKKWDMWCDEIKRHAKDNKHPYSDDFTNDIIFCMMIRGCFYCGDISTSIDRIDSKLEHTLDNCVGCCAGCNKSKGAADLSTFIRKAYYRVREKYYDDDDDIWFVYKNKPIVSQYKYNAKMKGVPFDLSKEDFDVLIKGDCKYCKRRPTTWFGIDREIPSKGYVIGNVVSCCLDCNIDKLEDDVDTMRARNERIVERFDTGELVVNNDDKVILHLGPRTYKLRL